MGEPQSALTRRARPLLGTLVTIQVAQADDDALQAVEAAFGVIALVHERMSAHSPASDLARLARARAGEAIAVHPHTAAVLRLACLWRERSGGAFDAGLAGRRLAGLGLRPALAAGKGLALQEMRLDGDVVHAEGPVVLDLGGIAKGYAVDMAVQVLRQRGVPSGLVNAGGDLRAFGPRAWRIELQHPVVTTRTRRLLSLRDAALASSTRTAANGEFVATRRWPARWQCSTVLARDCASADALTKWALQAPEPALQLRSVLARNGARMWRS